MINGFSTFGAKSLSTSRARTPYEKAEFNQLQQIGSSKCFAACKTNVQRGKRKLKERGREEEEEVTSQKSLDTRLDIPASDIRYSRARH